MGYLVQEVWELYDAGLWVYWHDLWNILDWVNLLLFVSAFCVRLALIVEFSNMNLDPRATTRYFNFQRISLLNSSENNIFATNGFLLWFKVYKYTRFFPPMRTVSDTIARSISNTFGFVIVVIFVLFGFSQAGVLAFGNDLVGFRSFIDSFYSLLRLLLGDFDFLAMQYSNRAFGPLYFLAFMIIVFFIMLSLFLAILNDAYLLVQADNRARAEKELNVVQVFREWVTDRTEFLKKRQERIKAFTADIAVADANNDAVLDITEIQAIFAQYENEAQSCLGVTSAQELLAKFDMDGNSVLDAEEQTRLVNAISEWKERAEAETEEITQIARDVDDPSVVALEDRQIALHMASLKRDLRLFFELELNVSARLIDLLEASGVGAASFINDVDATSYSSDDTDE